MIKIISMYFIPFQAWLSKNIHQPAGNWLAGYRQLEKALRDGKARSIGISNFEGKYIQELETKWETAPQFIQVEAHPYFTQKYEKADNNYCAARAGTYRLHGPGVKTKTWSSANEHRRKRSVLCLRRRIAKRCFPSFCFAKTCR